MQSTLLALCRLAWTIPASGQADERLSGTVQVASRLFLVGEVPSASTTQEDFLPTHQGPLGLAHDPG